MTSVTFRPVGMASAHPPRLVAAASALHRNALAEAEPLLRQHLRDDPFDARAIRMLAELAGRIGRYGDAETLLRRALELAPGFMPARSNLALVLYRLNRPTEALEQLALVGGEEAESPAHANLQAATLGRVGAFDEALALYAEVLRDAPGQPRVWMSYGHMLKTVGRQAEAIAAYRRAIELHPALGEAWWSLANLKTVPFTPEDIAAMQALLAGELAEEDRFHLDFALGKALADEGAAAPAFAHYAAGNALRRKLLPYNAAETTRFVDRMIAATPASLFERAGDAGCADPAPIFVLGMPRAGSTLVEQILSSHSMVEGTSELHDIPQLARGLADYPECLADLTADRLAELGALYIERTRVHRQTARPRFIDKLPNNWVHAALIRLILPHATIIDARRHPLACCFGNFRQHFARGQPFSYDLADMGHYYADYVRLMAHFDAVMPGRVHRVIYESMVDDTENQVRALLDHCGLAFEPACLAFHETARPVRTASSEQVRRPIFREGKDSWRPFAPWLGPLEQALGPVLAAYPEVPEAS